MKVLIFGAGGNGQVYIKYIENCCKEDCVAGVIDNNTELRGGGIMGYTVLSPEEIPRLEYDKIVITVESPQAVCEMKDQLKAMSIESDKIEVLSEDTDLRIEVFSKVNWYDEETDPRVRWLRDYVRYVNDHGMIGNLAECGVYRGEFAYFINKYFSGRKLYLFDTFEGFDQKDMEVELAFGNEAYNNSVFAKGTPFRHTHIEIVRKRMLHPDACIIKKGYFPETVQGIQEQFCFVNLDMDLYKPMYAALNYFWDCMTEGGVILLHDYFSLDLPGTAMAVAEFERQRSVSVPKIPIGDQCSLAIIKR